MNSLYQSPLSGILMCTSDLTRTEMERGAQGFFACVMSLPLLSQALVPIVPEMQKLFAGFKSVVVLLGTQSTSRKMHLLVASKLAYKHK